MTDSHSPAPSEACTRTRYPLLWALQRLQAAQQQAEDTPESPAAYNLLRKELEGLLGVVYRRHGASRLWKEPKDFMDDFFAQLFLGNRLNSYIAALENCCKGEDLAKDNALMFGYMRRCIHNWALDQQRKEGRQRRNLTDKFEGDLDLKPDDARNVADHIGEREDMAARRQQLVGILDVLSPAQCSLFCIVYYPLLRLMQGPETHNVLEFHLEQMITKFSTVLGMPPTAYRAHLETLAVDPDNWFKDGGFKRNVVAELTGMKEASVYATQSRLEKQIKDKLGS